MINQPTTTYLPSTSKYLSVAINIDYHFTLGSIMYTSLIDRLDSVLSRLVLGTLPNLVNEGKRSPYNSATGCFPLKVRHALLLAQLGRYRVNQGLNEKTAYQIFSPQSLNTDFAPSHPIEFAAISLSSFSLPNSLFYVAYTEHEYPQGERACRLSSASMLGMQKEPFSLFPRPPVSTL
jgi:hypothetical protein